MRLRELYKQLAILCGDVIQDPEEYVRVYFCAAHGDYWEVQCDDHKLYYIYPNCIENDRGIYCAQRKYLSPKKSWFF